MRLPHASGAASTSPSVSVKLSHWQAAGSPTTIAERLVISPATARTHVSRSTQKLGARDRAQLVVFAYESGLVSPGQALV